MKLPAACIYKKGFSLVELMMAVAILAVLIIGSLPLAINFYNIRQLDVFQNSIVQALRRAQLKAMSSENNSSFGVYIASDQYILFKGSSFMGRDMVFDEVFDLPANLQITSPSEIVFSKPRGIPLSPANIALTIDNRSEAININEVGRINY